MLLHYSIQINSLLKRKSFDSESTHDLTLSHTHVCLKCYITFTTVLFFLFSWWCRSLQGIPTDLPAFTWNVDQRPRLESIEGWWRRPKRLAAHDLDYNCWAILCILLDLSCTIILLEEWASDIWHLTKSENLSSGTHLPKLTFILVNSFWIEWNGNSRKLYYPRTVRLIVNAMYVMGIIAKVPFSDCLMCLSTLQGAICRPLRCSQNTKYTPDATSVGSQN